MKKRTKHKLIQFTGKAIKGLFKLVLIYPLKGVWFLSKRLYYSIKESRTEKKEIRSDLEKNYLDKDEEPAKGKLTAEPQFDSLKEIKLLKGKFESFQDKIYNNKSTIGLILGARGTGKSAIGMRLLENFKTKTEKKIYALGFKPSSLPNWIKVITGVEDIENNSVLLVDEGGIEFSSRKSMSDANTLLSEILLIARHKDLSVIFITQNSSNLEINAIRQADYLIMKPSSLLQIDFERKKIKEIYEQAETPFEELKDNIGLTYIYADNYKGFVTNSLPSFWNERVSKGYANK